MRSFSKKVIALLTILIITLYPTVILAETENDLNNQKNKNQQQITAAQDKKKEVEEEKNQTISEVNKLTEEITSYQMQISNLESQIDSVNKKIAEETKKLEEAEKKYNEQQETLNTRIVALYEAGETSYLDVLLSSQSVTDFISSYYIISEIAECDVDLLDQIDRQKQEITKTKEEIEASKNQLSTAKADKQRVSQTLQAKKNEKNTYVAQLSQEEQKIQQQIEELQQANISIDQKIKQKQAEAQARLAEQKRKEEEARRQQNNSNNGSSSSGSSSGGTTSSPSSSGYIYPVPSAYAKITTGWYYSNGSLHGAADFGTAGIAGQPVYAVADGEVILTQALTTSYGNYIIIMHDDGKCTLYAHGQAGSIVVKEGQRVKQGQQIMKVGNTGNSFGAHLHFEVRLSPGLYSNRVDPKNYL